MPVVPAFIQPLGVWISDGPLNRLGHRCHGGGYNDVARKGFLYRREAPDWTSDRYRNRRRQPKAGFVPAA